MTKIATGSRRGVPGESTSSRIRRFVSTASNPRMHPAPLRSAAGASHGCGLARLCQTPLFRMRSRSHPGLVVFEWHHYLADMAPMPPLPESLRRTASKPVTPFFVNGPQSRFGSLRFLELRRSVHWTTWSPQTPAKRIQDERRECELALLAQTHMVGGLLEVGRG